MRYARVEEHLAVDALLKNLQAISQPAAVCRNDSVVRQRSLPLNRQIDEGGEEIVGNAILCIRRVVADDDGARDSR
ncbi:MAG TPA: hypothetical protein VGG89_13390 [Candidatus Baltobacteraceae bacterium]|jgi:hypothetical protein